MKNIRLIVIVVPMLAMLTAIILSLVDLNAFLSFTQSIHEWILATFSSVFSIATFCFVLTCLWVFISPLGAIRIGGDDAKPLLSRWAWFSITLCTTVAIGILFWATTEPIYHLYQPGINVDPASPDAKEFAMVSLFMHWSFTPYAIYAVPGLTFALVFYNLKKPFSLAGPISVLIRRRVPPLAADILDAFALFTLVAGISASLGTGMLSISGGISHVSDIPNTPILMALVAIAIVAAFVISSASGLQKGIKILSDINTKFFFILAAFVLFAGPTLEIVSLAFDTLIQYIKEFPTRSLMLSDGPTQEWANSWTIFYWANWLAWAPLTALFLGRIARGYTVREYLLVNFVSPALFSIIWMSIFGGMAVHLDLSNNGMLEKVLQLSGPESVLYAVLGELPIGSILIVLIVFLSFISYVTAADSNTDAIASVCLKDTNPDDGNRSVLYVKLLWALLIGATAWIMTAFSGVDGIKMLSNLGGFPALIIVSALNITLLYLSIFKVNLLKKTKPDDE